MTILIALAAVWATVATLGYLFSKKWKGIFVWAFWPFTVGPRYLFFGVMYVVLKVTGKDKDHFQ